VFDWVLEGQENERVGDRREFDYVTVTAHSPLHCIASQRTPAWIILHMGIEGEGNVSEWAKLELGMGVQLFDEGLGEKNDGFEKVWLFGIIGKPYGEMMIYCLINSNHRLTGPVPGRASPAVGGVLIRDTPINVPGLKQMNWLVNYVVWEILLI